MNHELLKEINFIVEIDKLKKILRQNAVIGKERRENDAEHSWHICVMAMVFWKYFEQYKANMLKVIKMLLIHDLVEIYAGDTFCYDDKACENKKLREKEAAERIFSLLPKDICSRMISLWQEFDECTTMEARIASCMDRLQPFILNYHTQGFTWSKPGVTSQKVLKRNEILKELAPELWEYVLNAVNDSVNKGYLRR